MHCPDCDNCHDKLLVKLEAWENARASDQGGATEANKPQYITDYHRTCRFHFDEAVALQKEDEHHASIHDGESYDPVNPIEQGQYDDDPSPYGGTYSED